MRSTSKGLTVWNNTSDNFDHTQLAANWDLVDAYWIGFDATTQLPKRITTVSTVPTSATAGDLCMLTAPATSGTATLPAWSLLRYDGSQWLPVGDVAIQTTIPSSAFAGQVIVLSNATSEFAKWSVLRFDGTKWDHVGMFGYVDTGTAPNNIKGAQIAGDVYVNTSSRGIVMPDRLTGTLYRVYINNQQLTLEPVF